MITPLRYQFRYSSAYTLVELALVIMLGMAIASVAMLLLNQQLVFSRIFQSQNFLSIEAPLINNCVVRLVGNAEGYQLYEDIDGLQLSGQSIVEDAKVLVLRFRDADGSTHTSIISWEDDGAEADKGLQYRLVRSGAVPASPDWTISKRPEDVRFSIDTGILRMRIVGPSGEELIYSGTEQ